MQRCRLRVRRHRPRRYGEALQMVAAHAREVHGMDHVVPEVVAKVKAVMHDEPGPP